MPRYYSGNRHTNSWVFFLHLFTTTTLLGYFCQMDFPSSPISSRADSCSWWRKYIWDSSQYCEKFSFSCNSHTAMPHQRHMIYPKSWPVHESSYNRSYASLAAEPWRSSLWWIFYTLSPSTPPGQHLVEVNLLERAIGGHPRQPGSHSHHFHWGA